MGARQSGRRGVPRSLSLLSRSPLAVLLLAVAAVGVLAQEGTLPGAEDVTAVVPGTRIRVTSPAVPGGRVTGRLVEMDADELTLLDSEERQVGLPRENILKLEEQVSRRSRWPEGAVVGALGTLALICFDYDCSDVTPELVVVTGIGAGVGALVGRLLHSEKWRDVPLSPPRVAVTLPPQGGVGLSVSWRF